MRILSWLLIGTFITVFLVGCTPLQPPSGTQVDMEKKDFTLPLLTGGTLRLSDFLGQPVLLVFFTPTCGGCQTEAPLLETIYQRYRESDNFLVIGVGYVGQNGEGALQEFVQENGITYPVAIDTSATKIYQNYGVSTVPHNFFFNKEGNIVRSHVGPLTLDLLEQYVREIL